jgi:dihydrofolate synthase/folylpolyglutamate synthase
MPSQPIEPTPLSTLEFRGHWGIKKGLENISALLEGLGHPERAFPAILIAGTNGKGSTGAFLAHGLMASGLKIGWTTSPHLQSPAERIWINGQRIGEAELGSHLGQVLAAEKACGIKATYFELMISAALLAFSRIHIDLALVEVGMGGRWDSTNILNPILTILTNVALDHTEHLGNTLEAIAAEKLCTARSGRPLVLGPNLDPDWLQSLCESQPIMAASKKLDAEIFWDYSIVNGQRVALPGRHQVENLTTALKAIEELRGLGWGIGLERAFQGMAQAEWPGRLWSVPGLSKIVFDGAHNPKGAEALASHILECGIRPHIFFSAMADKDLFGMAKALATAKPLGTTIVSGNGPRWASLEAMQQAFAAAGHGGLSAMPMEELAPKLKKNISDIYIATGSLYFLGHLTKALGITL